MNTEEKPLCGGTMVRKMPEEVKQALANKNNKLHQKVLTYDDEPVPKGVLTDIPVYYANPKK